MRNFSVLLTSLLFSSPVFAADLTVKVENVSQNSKINPDYAYCAPNSVDGKNKRPEISWSAGPEKTLSYAIIVVDPDVPTDFSLANQQNKIIPATQKRQNFYHWLQADIPASVTSLPAGEGRGAAKSPLNIGIAGVNDYPIFMKKPTADFIGYDGPCPPWNDQRVHNYHFIVHALDVASLGLKTGFSWKEALPIIEKHSLAHGEVVGTYSLLLK